MDDVLVGVLGAALVLLVLVDALTTTVTVGGGAGLLTRRVTGVLWRVLLRVHRRDSDSSVLAAAGAVLLIVTVLVWVALLWAGWALVLLSSDSVVNSTTRAPAGVADVVYYAGFTVFTLGVGDFVATTSVTRVLTAAASFTGLFVITLAITYLISVVSAVVARRALAVQIATLGSDPVDMVTGGWDGDQFSSAFVQRLVNLTGALATSAEQHLAYPVLHYFHSSTRVTAAPVAVAHLDEALFLLQEAVQPAAAPEAGTVAPTRRAVDRYLHTVGATSTMPVRVDDPPPAPDLAGLRGAGIPVAGDADFGPAVAAAADRRRTLATMVVNDGWSW
ncbi:potassium channel family protein [uncultured Cellulomonas sp.]|uniref:potassium channel family protein n=1 Tax=uncultured Cellulomonas sp. TaxID=189682 RepID=UPI002616CCB1|nr:potassium channel family protein [uncultured Cellulomonas sp.]